MPPKLSPKEQKPSLLEHVREHPSLQIGLGMMTVGVAVEILPLPVDSTLKTIGGAIVGLAGCALLIREGYKKP